MPTDFRTAGDIAGGVAHDLNNEMTLILNHLELAARHVPACDPACQELEDVRRAAGRCVHMIDSLLRIGKEPAPLEAVDVRTLLEEAIRLLRGTLPATMKLALSVEPCLPPVLANATEMHRVITNLAMNAKAAMSGRGRFTVEASSRAGSVELKVSDTGRGMSPKVQARIFEPYFTTKRRFGGRGLGLAVVAGILKRHNAEISVETNPGKGTAFRISLPCAKME